MHVYKYFCISFIVPTILFHWKSTHLPESRSGCKAQEQWSCALHHEPHSRTFKNLPSLAAYMYFLSIYFRIVLRTQSTGPGATALCFASRAPVRTFQWLLPLYWDSKYTYRTLNRKIYIFTYFNNFLSSLVSYLVGNWIICWSRAHNARHRISGPARCIESTSPHISISVTHQLCTKTTKLQVLYIKVGAILQNTWSSFI